MSAVEALDRARATGVIITVDGEDLVLEASAPPPAAMLHALSSHKLEIIILLRSEKDRRTKERSSWAELKAFGLNRLFREQGKTGERGHIIDATVLHGERCIDRNRLLVDLEPRGWVEMSKIPPK